MFMGGKAFAYYYPVIASYLRETPLLPLEDRGDREAWSLPQCIKYQFEEPNYTYVRRLKRDVLDLCHFVRKYLTPFGLEPEELKSSPSSAMANLYGTN